MKLNAKNPRPNAKPKTIEDPHSPKNPKNI